jgi:Ankyrin repeats (3 copies)
MPARNLPARPNLEQYKKQAKDLVKAFRANEPDAIRRVQNIRPDVRKLALADAQFVIASEYGFENWSRFVDEIGRRSDGDAGPIWKEAENAVVKGDSTTLERLLLENEALLRSGRPQSTWLGGLTPEYSKGDARTIIAKNHEFDDWEQFASFEKAIRSDATVRSFEDAVDTIVNGDADGLERLIKDSPDLVRMRSLRRHRSTLLHYVGANGVEGFRQRTPRNAVRIATILLEAGAEINAVADMYGGGCTTLDLAATSFHPKRAGVQNDLIDLLLAHGARLDEAGNTLVNSCLANGREDAAEHLARRGASLDLEAAAGLGRLEVVQSFFDEQGKLKPTATVEQMRDGFTWACEYGHTPVVEFLLDHGMEVNERLPRPHGQTGLHWAAHGGHIDTVNVLLQRQAPLDVKDLSFDGTPLGWALVGCSVSKVARGTPKESYYDVVAALVEAGAPIEPAWITPEKAEIDPRMYAILRGKQSDN